jgi:hypothetical protein
MSFYQRYELERLIADAEAKTFLAVENATGRRVFLHFFGPPGRPILTALESKLGRTPGHPQLPLIELGEFAGSPYAVTEIIEPFTTIRQWVDSIDGNALPAPGQIATVFEAPKPGPKPPQVPATQPGEFTRFFSDAPPNAPQPNAPPPKHEPGEFTRWFDSSPPGASKPAPQRQEFEDLFGAPSVPAPSPARPPQASAKPSWPSPSPDAETGQFTRLFGSGPSGEAIDIEEEQARAARSAQPESRPFQAPSEFTRVFGPEAGSNSPRSPVTRTDSASGIFGSREAKPNAPATNAPTKTAGPGEYTRITSRAELEAELAARDKAPPPAPVPLEARRGLTIVLAIGGLLLVATIIAILVLVKKH